ncbi:MAG: hypothetical protein ABI268_08260 [Rhodanobacter sp.]
MRAVEVMTGRCWTLRNLYRARLGPPPLCAPFTALNTMLGNYPLHGERERSHAAIARALVRSGRPLMTVAGTV